MSTSICKKCKEKAANRPGTLCFGCWKVEEGARPEKMSDDEETMLEAMRWVSIHKASEDRTNQQGEMRKWLSEDRPNFMRYRASLEAKAVTGKPSGQGGESSTASPTGTRQDPARERVRESLEAEFELLEEYMAKREAFLAWEAERAAAVAG
jgi:hypothetical protein